MSSTPDVVMASAIHFDTIAMSHCFKSSDLPPGDDLARLGFEKFGYKRTEHAGAIITGVYNPFSKRSHEPRITVIRSDYGYSGISIELSIAKLLDNNGLSAQADDDIEFAFDTLESLIWERTGGVEFNPRTAKLSRLDVNADFPVGEDRIIPYINAMPPACPV
jgi:hypothetical protein